MLPPATYIEIIDTCQRINSESTGFLHGALTQLKCQLLFDTTNYHPTHFTIKELAPQKVIDSLEEELTWQQFDSRLLWTLDAIREYFNRKVFVNYAGLQNRGLRSSKNSSIEWSQHCAGRAVDFEIDGLTDNTVREIIISKQKEVPAFRFITAIEKDTDGWTHIDVRNSASDTIILFSK
jgi:hypothetical protein